MAQDGLKFSVDDAPLYDDPTGGVYCPYTNDAECALLAKGWQPQELCIALECSQMKLFRHGNGRRSEAA